MKLSSQKFGIFAAIAISITIILLVIVFNFFIAKSIEGFQEDNTLAVKESELRAALTKITDRLCPLQRVVQTTIAKNLGEKPVNNPNQAQMDEAYKRMLKEARGLLYACPKPPVDLYALPIGLAEQLGRSLQYTYTKLVSINQQTQKALSGDLVQTDDLNSGDPYGNLDATERAAAEAQYTKTLADFAAQSQPPPPMTPAEKEALLLDRRQAILNLMEQKTNNNEVYVDALLASSEAEYKQLQRTQSGAESGSLRPSAIPSS